MVSPARKALKASTHKRSYGWFATIYPNESSVLPLNPSRQGYFFGILTDSIWHKDGGYVALLGFHFVGTLLQLWRDGQLRSLKP
jgi:hypothetical protein